MKRRSTRRYGRPSDGLDHLNAHDALCTTRVSSEGPGVGDALHSVPTKRQRDRDEHARDRRSIPRQGGKISTRGRRSPHIWFFMAMLSAIEMTLEATDRGTCSTRRWKDGGSGADQENGRELDGARIELVGDSVQASPNQRKAWPTSQVPDYFRRRNLRLLQLEEARRSSGTAEFIHAVGRSHGNAGQSQREDNEDSRDRAYPTSLRSRGTAGKSSSRKHGETTDRGNPRSRERKRKRGDGSGAEGACKSSALSQRPMKMQRKTRMCLWVSNNKTRSRL